MMYGIKRIYSTKPVFPCIDKTDQPNGGYEVWYSRDKDKWLFSPHIINAVAYTDLNNAYTLLTSGHEWLERVEELSDDL